MLRTGRIREIAMTAPVGQRTVFRARLNEAYDGAIRLLIDAQRFGLGLAAMTLGTSASGEVEVVLTLEVPEGGSTAVIAERLMRHPVVRQVDVLPPPAANDEAEVSVVALELAHG
jgi:hypothetical protein